MRPSVRPGGADSSIGGPAPARPPPPRTPPTPPALLPVANSPVPIPSGTRGGKAARRQRRSPPPLRHPPCMYLRSYGRPPPSFPRCPIAPPSRPPGTPAPHDRARDAADSYTGGGGFTAAGSVSGKRQRGLRRRWRWSEHCSNRMGHRWEVVEAGTGGAWGAGSRSERTLPDPCPPTKQTAPLCSPPRRPCSSMRRRSAEGGRLR